MNQQIVLVSYVPGQSAIARVESDAYAFMQQDPKYRCSTVEPRYREARTTKSTVRFDCRTFRRWRLTDEMQPVERTRTRLIPVGGIDSFDTDERSEARTREFYKERHTHHTKRLRIDRDSIRYV